MRIYAITDQQLAQLSSAALDCDWRALDALNRLINAQEIRYAPGSAVSEEFTLPLAVPPGDNPDSGQ